MSASDRDRGFISTAHSRYFLRRVTYPPIARSRWETIATVTQEVDVGIDEACSGKVSLISPNFKRDKMRLSSAERLRALLHAGGIIRPRPIKPPKLRQSLPT